MKLPPKGRAVSAAVSRTTAPASSDHVSVTMPSAPAFETAAASLGTAAMGAWTIGRSIPSKLHTGVVMSLGVPAGPAGDTSQRQPPRYLQPPAQKGVPARVVEARGLASP